jgi:DNA-binding NarL/FixJ family response regulator
MPGYEVVGVAHDGFEAVELARRFKPDVVLMDARMPGLSGAEATARVLAVHPHAAVVMVTMFADDESLFHALRAGATGYVVKGASLAELRRAIEAAANGEAFLGQGVASRIGRYFSAGTPSTGAQPFADLTRREHEVLDLLAEGMTNGEIARRLEVTVKTARNHVSNVLGKLGARTRTEAALKAREAHLRE